MRDITRLNIKNIDSYGYYKDKNKKRLFRLSDEEIIEIRRYHNNKLIAQNRLKMTTPTYKVNVYNEDKLKKRVRLKKDKKRRRITKRWLKRNARALIIRGLLGVVLASGVFGAVKGINGVIKNHNKQDIEYQTEVSTEEVAMYDTYEEETESSYVNEYNEEVQNRIVLIKHYCDIYGVDYNIVYNLLVNMTNNFSSDDYYEGRIPGIRCKGVAVQATSEEELLIYAIRNIKQSPEDFNLDRNKLYVDTGYKADSNYFEQIRYYAQLFGVDECLIAAIVQSETGFDSPLFNEYNNPAGLRLADGWWKFGNKTEGFIELCLEIIKDYRKAGYSTEDVSEDIIVAIGNIHAPLSDNNYYWVGNVTANYYKYKENYVDYFGEQNNNNISL